MKKENEEQLLSFALDRIGISKEDIYYKQLFCEQIFMGAGNSDPKKDFSGQNLKLLHEKIRQALSLISGIQQPPRPETKNDYKEWLVDFNEYEDDLVDAVQDIVVALLGGRYSVVQDFEKEDDLEEQIREQSKLVKDEEMQLRALKSKCKHDNQFHTEKYGYVVCRVCDKHLGWHCPESPDHVCHYCTTDGMVVLVDREKVSPPAEWQGEEHETEDCCIYCGEPKDRK